MNKNAVKKNFEEVNSDKKLQRKRTLKNKNKIKVKHRFGKCSLYVFIPNLGIKRIPYFHFICFSFLIVNKRL